jgi:WD40 repeat protein
MCRTRTTFSTAVLTTVLAALLALALAPPASATHHGKDPKTRHALFVGNNWEGTADVLLPRGDFRRLDRINIIPDFDERMQEITLDPVRLGYFLAIRQLIGEGNDQFVDDMFTSADGRTLAVSRPSFADVVGIDLKTEKIVWRFEMEGQRSDHMGLSPDGKTIAVSDSTANVVHVLDIETGKELWQFPSGDSPHENTFSEDGKRLYHASIGLVYTPTDDPELDSTKGDRFFEIVDTKTHEVIERINMGQKLDEAGYPKMSAAVRPMALMGNEHYVYFQVSFFHGFVEYDLRKDKVTRVAQLPISDKTKDIPREQYLLDSAHHGLALSGDEKTLCVAGTMSDYAALVSRKTFKYKIFRGLGTKPYWSTSSNNGKYCFLSWSGTDNISVFDYEKGKEIANIPVGDHPQRIRVGDVRRSWIKAHR